MGTQEVEKVVKTEILGCLPHRLATVRPQLSPPHPGGRGGDNRGWASLEASFMTSLPDITRALSGSSNLPPARLSLLRNRNSAASGKTSSLDCFAAPGPQREELNLSLP